MRALFVLLAYVATVGVVGALNCYQGQQNSSLPVSGSPTACPSVSLSCLKIYDNYTQLTMRSCQTTNCTMNNQPSPSGFCQNTTQYPFHTYCCCYGDGCNGAAAHSSLLLHFGWLSLGAWFVGWRFLK